VIDIINKNVALDRELQKMAVNEKVLIKILTPCKDGRTIAACSDHLSTSVTKQRTSEKVIGLTEVFKVKIAARPTRKMRYRKRK